MRMSPTLPTPSAHHLSPNQLSRERSPMSLPCPTTTETSTTIVHPSRTGMPEAHMSSRNPVQRSGRRRQPHTASINPPHPPASASRPGSSRPPRFTLAATPPCRDLIVARSSAILAQSAQCSSRHRLRHQWQVPSIEGIRRLSLPSKTVHCGIRKLCAKRAHSTTRLLLGRSIQIWGSSLGG